MLLKLMVLIDVLKLKLCGKKWYRRDSATCEVDTVKGFCAGAANIQCCPTSKKDAQGAAIPRDVVRQRCPPFSPLLPPHFSTFPFV